MSSVQQRKTCRQAPVARTALEQASAEVRADREQEARVLLTQKKGLKRIQRSSESNPSIDIGLAMASRNLAELVEIRCNDVDWDDAADSKVDFAIDLALALIQELVASKPTTFERILFDWAQISSVIDLAKAAFSRPTSLYGQRLSSLSNAFTVLGEMMEIADMKEAA